MALWDVNWVQEELQIPIHTAIQSNDITTLKTLINQIQSETNIFWVGEIFLIEAAKYGSSDICTMLIDEYGVNVNCKINDISPLIIAYETNHIETFKLLSAIHFANKDDMILRDPLHPAILNEDLDLIDFLITKVGIIPTEKSSKLSITPIEYAVEKLKINAARHLVRQHGVPVKTIPGILHHVAKTGNIELFDLFMSFDIDINAIFKIQGYHKTPLICAIESNHLQLAKHILRLYSPIEQPNLCVQLSSVMSNRPNESVLLNYIAPRLGDIELFELMGATITNWDKKDGELLRYAAIGGNISIIKELLFTYKVDTLYEKDPFSLHFRVSICLTHNNIELIDVMMQHPDVKKAMEFTDQQKRTPLLRALLDPHKIQPDLCNIVEHCIKQYSIKADTKDWYGVTVLHYAAQRGNIQLIDYILSTTKLKPDLEDDYNKTPLFYAAESYQWDTVKHLIMKYKVDVNVHKHCGILHYFINYIIDENNKKNINNNNTTTTTPQSQPQQQQQQQPIYIPTDLTLLDSILATSTKWKFDMEDNDGNTPSLKAALNGLWDISKRFVINHKADVNKKNKKDITILHVLAEIGNVQLLNEFMSVCKLKVDADDEFNNTPGIIAASKGHWDFVKELLFQYKADGNQKNKNGITILHYVSEIGNITLLDELMSRLKLKVNVDDSTSMTTLLKSCQNGHFLYAKHLVDMYKCDIHDKDNKGRNIIHYLAEKGDVQLLLQFTNYKLKADIEDNGNETPAFIAARLGHFDFLCTLFEHFKIDPNDTYSSSKLTLLHYIAQKSNDIQLLDRFITIVNNGKITIKIDQQTSTGLTPCLVAAENKNWDICERLITQYNANTKITTNDHKCLLRFIILQNDIQLLERFSQYQLDPRPSPPSPTTTWNMTFGDVLQPYICSSIEIFYFFVKHFTIDYNLHISGSTLLNILGSWAPPEAIDLLFTKVQYEQKDFDILFQRVSKMLTTPNVWSSIRHMIIRYNAIPTLQIYIHAATINDIEVCSKMNIYMPQVFDAALLHSSFEIVMLHYDKFPELIKSEQSQIGLLSASKSGDIQLLQYLLSKTSPGDINHAQIIATVAAYNHIELLQYLISQQFPINGDEKWNPLFASIKMCAYDSLQLLLSLPNIRTDIRDKEGRTMIYFAAKQCRSPLLNNKGMDKRLQMLDYLLHYKNTNNNNTNNNNNNIDELCPNCKLSFLLLYVAKKGIFTAMNYLIVKCHADPLKLTEKGKSIYDHAKKSKNKIAELYAQSLYYKRKEQQRILQQSQQQVQQQQQQQVQQQQQQIQQLQQQQSLQ